MDINVNVKHSIPKVNTLSGAVGTQKTIIQRLTALASTTNSIRVQLLGCYPKAAEDETGLPADDIISALSVTQHDMFKLIEELERDLGAICERLGDAYNPDVVQPEFGG